MAESIEIHNFGPIKEVIIPELKQVNVLVGALGSGKSIIMKVIAMFQWLYRMQCIHSHFKYSGLKHIHSRLRIGDVLRRRGLDTFLQPSTLIIYRNSGYELVLSEGRMNFSELVPQEELSFEKVAYVSDKRIAISDMDESRLSVNQGLFYLKDTFYNYKQALDSISSTEIPYLGLKLEKKKEDNVNRVVVSPTDSDEYSLALVDASSSTQSSVPLHIIATYFGKHYNLVQSLNYTLFNYLAGINKAALFNPDNNLEAFPNRKINLFVEEPELNLFPEKQKRLLEYLISMCNHPKPIPVGMNLTFATNSPHLLSTLNVLMLAKRAFDKDKARTQTIVPQDCMLDAGKVAAWEMSGGGVRPLINEQSGLIDGTCLGSASDLVGEQIAALNDIIHG